MIRAAVIAAAMVVGVAAHAAPPVPPVFLHVHAVVDGDTIKVIDGERIVSVRFRGIDAPEMRGRCPEERQLAREARNVVYRATLAGVWLRDRKPGGGGFGRDLATVHGADGEDVGELLVTEMLARPYDGKSKRKSWCYGKTEGSRE